MFALLYVLGTQYVTPLAELPATVEEFFALAKAILVQYHLDVAMVAIAIIGVALSFYRQLRGG